MIISKLIEDNSELVRTISFEELGTITHAATVPARVRITFVNDSLHDVEWLWYSQQNTYMPNDGKTAEFMQSPTFWEYAVKVSTEIKAMENQIEYGNKTTRIERNPDSAATFQARQVGTVK